MIGLDMTCECGLWLFVMKYVSDLKIWIVLFILNYTLYSNILGNSFTRINITYIYIIFIMKHEFKSKVVIDLLSARVPEWANK